MLSVFDTASLRLVQSIPFATDRPIDSEFTQGLDPAEAGRHAGVAWVSETTAILGAWDSVTAIDLATGEKRWEARGFRDRVFSVSVSTDETLVIASDFYGTTRLLRFDDGHADRRPTGQWLDDRRRAWDRAASSAATTRSSCRAATSPLIVDWDTGTVRLVDVDSRTEATPPFTAFSGLGIVERLARWSRRGRRRRQRCHPAVRPAGGSADRRPVPEHGPRSPSGSSPPTAGP